MHVCTYVCMEIICMKLGMHVGYSVRLSVYVVYSCTWSFKGNAGIAKKSHHGWNDRMGKLGCKKLSKREVNMNKPCVFILHTNIVNFMW
ncbi:hypothetical protein HanIR_Chr14g0720491 [Helianthus annuus]|nr:hypothetical protein HanIR_Chr14g0720491 [Helianthus annuus]